ncbi:sel1 repeat family protein [Psychrobacter sp. NG254]|uniref:tetratricopeptide repeat protein n=1 Tax=Psychrobacter sp. NG254 TaxID=2782003 RepID=UPI00188833F0|nr:SEL1-like repeat protein [Psychrobacter sp. NG254]MBF2718365.1 sel1 repeat family protein [Psychrobacter sp. NG254]
MSASPLTPLDYIAVGYWQDFLAGRAIAGGIAYEKELRACVLDESLESLQRVDTLLSQVRRDLIRGALWDEATLLGDEYYRNFMVFLGIYAGRVLASQWQNQPQWYGQFELRKRYPNLSLINDDFYQHMAVSYGDNQDDTVVKSLFFVLEPIGLRLFGHIDRQFDSVQGNQVASGLYQAVIERLPNLLSQSNGTAVNVAAQNTAEDNNVDVHLNTHISISQSTHTHQPTQQTLSNHDSNEFQEHIAVEIRSIAANAYEVLASQTAMDTKPLIQPELSEPEPKPERAVTDTQPPINIKSSPIEPLPTKPSPILDMFAQLLIELDEIEVPQTAGQDNYQQACKVLDQFEQHIDKQDKPRDQIVFSDKHIVAKTQALQQLQSSVEAGNTAAMLRLAIYELLNEGLVTDKKDATEAGTALVKQAASKNDSRAQRLLSKMYYQGIGVVQDTDNGKHWLEQAADNGHIAAASLVQQWQQAEALMMTRKQEQHSTKRYLWLFAAVIVVALLIIIIV